MTFPDTPLDLRAELQVGPDLTDITSRVYTRDPISITYGMPAEGTQVDPGSCSLTLDNRDGRFSPRNPLGVYYGALGRNSPLRISVPTPDGESYLRLDGTAAGSASTPDASPLDITGDIDVRVEATTDWNRLDVRRALIGKWSASDGQRSWILWLDDGVLSLVWTTGGTVATAFNAGVVLPRGMPRRSAVRAALDVSNAGGHSITMYTAPTLDGPWVAIAATASTTGTTSIFNSNAPLSIAPSSVDFSPNALPVLGRIHRAEVRSGINGTVVAAPDFRPLTGAGSFVDSAGRTWTQQGTAEISDREPLFTGEVSSWPPRWATSERDAWVPIEAAGILRRLGQGRKPLDSTLRRRLPTAPGLLAYWPMEDGAGATAASSAATGVAAAKTTGLTWAAESTLGGSSPLPTIGNPATLSASVPAAGTQGWQVEMVYKLGELPATQSEILRLTTSGSAIQQIAVYASTAGIRVEGVDTDGDVIGFVLFTNATALADFVGDWNRLAVFVADAGGGQTSIIASWRNIADDSFWYAIRTLPGTMGQVRTITGTWGEGTQGMAIGHLTAVSIPGVGTVQGSRIYDGADDGFTGETTLDRMNRLASETGLPLVAIDGDESILSEAMGPQLPAQILDLVEDAAATDGGILFEDTERLGLIYRDRATLGNQEPRLILDYAAKHVAPPLEPVDDDQVTRNDVTVTRQGGGSGRVVIEDGPLSVLPPEEGGVGIYDTSLTVNVATDDRAIQIAGWQAHMGTWDEARYPSVTVMLHRNPDLIPGVLALRIGDVLRIVNPPAYTGPGPLDLMVRQIKHTPLPRSWVVVFACTPAAVWNTAQLPGSGAASLDFPHADTTASRLAAATVSDDTTLSVETTAGPRWVDTTTFPSDFPFDIAVAGEVMRVTRITGTGTTQTFTVTRSINGISKVHSAHEAVSLANPAIVGL